MKFLDILKALAPVIRQIVEFVEAHFPPKSGAVKKQVAVETTHAMLESLVDTGEIDKNPEPAAIDAAIEQHVAEMKAKQ